MINPIILNTLHVVLYGKPWEFGTEFGTLSTKVKYQEYISKLNKQSKAKNTGNIKRKVFE